MAVARKELSGTGSFNSALAIGGEGSPPFIQTEEWVVPEVVIKTVTDS